jgi:hypothetical protein
MIEVRTSSTRLNAEIDSPAQVRAFYHTLSRHVEQPSNQTNQLLFMSPQMHSSQSIQLRCCNDAGPTAE